MDEATALAFVFVREAESVVTMEGEEPGGAAVIVAAARWVRATRVLLSSRVEGRTRWVT